MKEYRKIKSVLKKEYFGINKIFYVKMANTLLELFDKFDDNTNSQVIYRGDVIETEEEYEKYLTKKVGDIIVLENSILSFTLDKDVAIKSYQNSDKYRDENTPTVLIVVENRNSKFLDITEYSCLPEEKEVICNKGLTLKIKNIEHNQKNIIITTEEN